MLRTTAPLAIFTALVLATGAQATPITFELELEGSQEVGIPGDPDGIGKGVITLSEKGGVKWQIRYADIATPVAMHIHSGAAGTNGPVVVSLGIAGSPGVLEGSVFADPLLIARILANPSAYYVNIHSREIPSGAIRDQLGNPIPEPSAALVFGLGVLLMRSGVRRSVHRC